MGLDISIYKIKKQDKDILDWEDFHNIIKDTEDIIYWRKNYEVLDFIQKKLKKALGQCSPEKLNKSDIFKLNKYLFKMKKTKEYMQIEYFKYQIDTGLEELKKIEEFDYNNYDLFIDWVF